MSIEYSIAAVIVLYKSSLYEATSFTSFLKGISVPVLIYDNSPDPQEVSLTDNFSYYHNPNNPGVSAAYNHAMLWAKDLGATHLILLDSDSLFPANAIEHYASAARDYPGEIILPEVKSEEHKISPFYFSLGKSHYGDTISFGELSLGRVVAINSGMMIPLKLMQRLNGYNEKLPLDWSDIEFIRRAGKSGYRAQHIPLVIQHSLSEHEEGSIESVKFRFEIYLKGIKIVASNYREQLLMFFWAKMKALKLCVRHQTTWFILHFIKRFYA